MEQTWLKEVDQFYAPASTDLVDGEENKRICKKCGGGDFYKDGKCKPCKRTYRKKRYPLTKEREKETTAKWRSENKDRVYRTKREWQIKNKESCYLSTRIWYQKNREKVIAQKSIYASKNSERIREYTRERRKKFPELHRTRNRNRKALLKSAEGKLSVDIEKKLFDLQKGKCVCCRRKLGSNYHLDHIIPISKGGKNSDDNVQLLRAECNLKKRAKDPVDYMQEKGFLL